MMNGREHRGSAVGSPHGRSDRVLLLGLTTLLAIAAALTPIGSYDYWWHLATGRLILESGAIPHVDPFSFTAIGTAWVDHEWLFQIIAYGLHSSIGPSALIILKILCVLFLTFLFAGHLKREGHGPAGTTAILVVMLVGACFRLQVRPELATLVIVPLAIVLAIRARESGCKSPLVAIVALCALGANLHVGIVLVPALLALGAGVTILLRMIPGSMPAHVPPGGERERFERRLAVTAVASFAAISINPYGPRIYAVPFELKRLLDSLPWPNLEWARPEVGDFPLFYATLTAVAIIVIASYRRIDPIATPALLLVGLLALLHLRNIGLFFLLLPPGLGRPVRALVDRIGDKLNMRLAHGRGTIRLGFLVAAVLAVAAIPMLAVMPPRIKWGFGIASVNEPAAAVDFLERESIGAKLFNDVRFGGYLIWRRAPEAPVFIDGRNEVYADLLHDIARALEDGASWEALLSKHDIDSALLRYPGTLQKVIYAGEEGRPPTVGERAFSAAFFHRERWALVYWDDDAMIYLRRAPKHRSVIARLEYRALHPDDWRHAVAEVATGRAPLAPILEDLDRKLQEDPDCHRARWLYETFSRLDRNRKTDHRAESWREGA
ncbi:MAG: hypothetical protein O7A63_00205 [Acidobacteria bacterium]|nr:hypothetical protein [Acidobacteriota bacterium]